MAKSHMKPDTRIDIIYYRLVVGFFVGFFSCIFFPPLLFHLFLAVSLRCANNYTRQIAKQQSSRNKGVIIVATVKIVHCTVTHGGNNSLASVCILLVLSVTGEKKKWIIHFHSIYQLKRDSINYILATVLRCVSNSADEVCSGTGATSIFTCAVSNCSGQISRKNGLCVCITWHWANMKPWVRRNSEKETGYIVQIQ